MKNINSRFSWSYQNIPRQNILILIASLNIYFIYLVRILPVYSKLLLLEKDRSKVIAYS